MSDDELDKFLAEDLESDSLEEKLGRLGRRGSPLLRDSSPHRIWRATLPFRESKERVFIAAPQRPFKPLGFIIWGAPPLATVEIQSGVHLQASASADNIPAKWFASGRNFEQVKKVLDEGIDIPTWCNWDIVRPGIVIRALVRTDGGALIGGKAGVELCMWGETIW